MRNRGLSPFAQMDQDTVLFWDVVAKVRTCCCYSHYCVSLLLCVCVSVCLSLGVPSLPEDGQRCRAEGCGRAH